MVLRTLSKWAGLAGLRLGYGILPPSLVECILKIKMPYNVNVAAQVAVEASLEDKIYLMNNVSAIIQERERLFAALSGISWIKPLPSKANFIFCHVLKGNAVVLQQKLQDMGILVRYFDQAPLQNGWRISVGKPEHTDALVRALRRIEEEGNV
jgi:histidinol-phosphate aminotransferase